MLMLKFMQKCKVPRIAKIIKQIKLEGLSLYDFKNYYRPQIIEKIYFCFEKKIQWNTGEFRNRPFFQTNDSLKCANLIQQGKGMYFQQMVLETR